MHVAICWSGVSGYLAACWRALTQLPGVQLTVFAEPAASAYAPEVTDGINLVLLRNREWEDPVTLAPLVAKASPDIVVISGWARCGFAGLPFQAALNEAPFLLAMDTPWRADLKQKLARFRLKRLVKRMAGVYVSGERGAQYALNLGFAPDRICQGIYGCDYDAFSLAMRQRLDQPHWPRRFLYVGRYVPAKGLGTLVAAYREYRKHVENPWPLSCYGSGEMESLLKPVEGVALCGFIQPPQQPSMFAEHGVLVMPSIYEPWGVVLAEAGAAGLPAICTSAVCSSIDLVRHLYNGYVVPPKDSASLAEAMCWMHEHADLIPEMGRRSQVYAEAYSAQNWAKRWHWMLERVLHAGHGQDGSHAL